MDPFLISILIISFTGVIGAFLKGRHRDRCLKHFQDLQTKIIRIDKKDVWGLVNVESNSIEIVFQEDYIIDIDGVRYSKKNFIIYKNEFKEIDKLIHVLDIKSELGMQKRKRLLNSLVKPNLFKKSWRKTLIFFNIVKDALLEVAGTVMKKTKLSEANKDKLLGTFKDNSLNSYSGSSHEPVWEKYIGKQVILEQIVNGNKKEYVGILKEYSSQYILLYNVNIDIEQQILIADIIFPRNNSIIRHFSSNMN